MENNSNDIHRKNEHISLAKKFYNKNKHGGFENIRFIPNSLPETSFKDINLNTNIGPLKMEWPFYIEAMSGGSKYTAKINSQLSNIAKKTGIAMASGSQTVALKNKALVPNFINIRENNPTGIIIANLNAHASIEQAKTAINMLKADALEIHINVAQELIMPEGDREFFWIDNIKKLVEEIKIPVIIKEVGFGMSQSTIKKLVDSGVKYINIAGTGGTNFAEIENFRRSKKDFSYLSSWGLSTIESLFESKALLNSTTIIASGGIKSPLDIVKALYLGANAIGIAGAILNSLISNGEEETIAMIYGWQKGIVSIFTMLGVKNIKELRNKAQIILSPDLLSYLKQRKIS